jgi:hypothetical protein
MALKTNFKTSLNILLTELSITDTSTDGYDQEGISSRELLFEYPDGSSNRVPFPFKDGVGDVFVYPVATDTVLAVTLILNPAVQKDDSDYSQTINLLLANRFQAGIAKFRKELFLDKYNDANSADFHEAHENLRILEGFYRTAKDRIMADLPGAAKALEYGIDFMSAKCDC